MRTGRVAQTQFVPQNRRMLAVGAVSEKSLDKDRGTVICPKLPRQRAVRRWGEPGINAGQRP